MRWFVEVSRVGESSVAEEYCVEAKQWQAALQEARKLRGDSGALSKFSIELLDRGYRAVDPSLKLRYLINEAPPEATLTGSSSKHGSAGESSSGKQRVAESIAPTAFSTSDAPLASGVPRPGSQAAPRPNSVPPPRPDATPIAAPRSQQLLVPDDPVPPALAAPGLVTVLGVPPESLRPPVPAFELVRQRGEEPSPESPITYRELAFAVKPGVTRPEVEVLLLDRYQATRAAIEASPPGKFVQLAVFDHVFQRRPERPPLATLAWKDWRGAPVLAFPGFGDAPMGPMSQVPPAPESLTPPPNSASLPPPSLASLPLPPSSVVPHSAPVVPMAPVVLASLAVAVMPAVPEPVVSAPVAAAPLVSGPVTSVAESAPVVAAPGTSESLVAAPVAPAESVTTAAAVEPAVAAVILASAEPVAPPAPAPAFELNFESTPFNAAASPPSSAPSAERTSRPRLAVGRRRAGEDLISELFEFMHELHFMRDVAAGAEFVLSVLDEVLPCEGALIHVFDINTSHFVVVRAKGPNARAVLLQRMPDQAPFAVAVMRGSRAFSVKDATVDPLFTGPRWQAVGVAPRAALCGAVKQGGRYLGLIELVNPQGDVPFHQSELNALDYICEQFAEFLSKKPITLSGDVVLAKV